MLRRMRAFSTLLAVALLLGCSTPTGERSTRPEVAMEDAGSTIDGRSVTAVEFDAFEKSLRDRKDVIACAETKTGGFSTYEGTDPHGVRYQVKVGSENGRSFREAMRLTLDLNP